MTRRAIKVKAEKFPALTGIRAVAAYLVFFHHFPLPSGKVPSFVVSFLREGHVGVTLFFVLSGFLITYNYSAKSISGSRQFWLTYMSRRIARIYPLYIFLLALTFLLPWLLNGRPAPRWPVIFLNLTLWKGYFTQFYTTGIAPAWSLTVEETFYFLAPFLFAGVRRYGYLAVQAILYGAGAVLLCVGIGAHFIALEGFFRNFVFLTLYTFFGRSFEFVAGMALAHAFLRNPARPRMPKSAALTYLSVAGFVGVVFWISRIGLYHPLGMALNNIVLPVVICVLFAGLLWERTIFRAILSWPPVIFLGRASYAFYLVHDGVLAGITQVHLAFIHNAWIQYLGLFAILNLISVALYLCLEHPANLAIRRWSDHLASPFPLRPDTTRAEPGLRHLAIAWTTAIVLIFGGWYAASFIWLLPTTDVWALHGSFVNRSLGTPLAAKTDFFVITSRVGDVPRLTYKVGGVPVSDGPFIFAHANSLLEFDISSEGASVFEFSTGLDDVGGADRGSVQYFVRGDEKTLLVTPIVHALEKPVRYTVSVEGVQRLQLAITDAGDGPNSDESYWIRPRLR